MMTLPLLRCVYFLMCANFQWGLTVLSVCNFYRCQRLRLGNVVKPVVIYSSMLTSKPLCNV